MSRTRTEADFPSMVVEVAVEWNGAAESEPVDLSGCTLGGFDLPAGFAGSLITVQRYSAMDSAYKDVHVGGVALTIAAAASKQPMFPNLAPLSFLGTCRFVSDAAETCEGRALVAKVIG
jgi:hypothetical protein